MCHPIICGGGEKRGEESRNNRCVTFFVSTQQVWVTLLALSVPDSLNDTFCTFIEYIRH